MYHPNELDQQIENLRTLQESYDHIAGAAEAYNTGKVELVANLEFKGVPASATETLPQLAEKVRDIAQTTTVIEGGGMYAAQQFGDANPAQSPLWNLYDVLAEMKTRFMGAGQYAALIVCEYYKSENGVSCESLQLQGADAYYTCDGDFYDVSSPLHVWHDSDNDKSNRWVCFLFVTEGARLNITNTAISPRSMYIGGHIGTIEYFVDGRLTDFVCGVEDTDVLDNFLQKKFTQKFGQNCIIRNIKNAKGLSIASSGLIDIELNTDEITFDGSADDVLLYNSYNASEIIIRGVKKYSGGSDVFGGIVQNINTSSNVLVSIKILGTEEISSIRTFIFNRYGKLQRLYISDLKRCPYLLKFDLYEGAGDLMLIDVGAMETNLNVQYWNPTNVLADADKKAQLIDNIKNHILARVSDATGGTQLVFTISTNMYNAIASETITWNDQTMSLADAFLTKNWLLAGA